MRIKEHRAVDSKDKVRAELRRLMRRTVTRTRAGRAFYRGLRKEYRASIRRERVFYWEYRLKPVTDPQLHLSYIQDGATQTWYKLPRYPGVDHGRDGVQFKLVGNLFHGHVLVLSLVSPHMPDDANLFCHCLHSSLAELKKVRVRNGQPAFLPPHVRLQLDGVSTNWGKVSIAFVEHFVKCGVPCPRRAARARVFRG